MRRIGWICVIAIGLSGCAPTIGQPVNYVLGTNPKVECSATEIRPSWLTTLATTACESEGKLVHIATVPGRPKLDVPVGIVQAAGMVVSPIAGAAIIGSGLKTIDGGANVSVNIP